MTFSLAGAPLKQLRSAIAIGILSATFLAVTSADAQDIDPTAYPSLSNMELGHIRHMAKLSRQLPGDWTDMGSDWFVMSERNLQYQLAFMSYALGVTQHSVTPNYRDLYREIIDALFQKMQLPDVWDRWALTSRGGGRNNPTQTRLNEGWIDPVRKHNIMLSGHVLQMAILYEMLYREEKYTQPGSIVFEFDSFSWGFGPESFEYDIHSLADVIYEQLEVSDFYGAQCEPNLIFPECNQHPVLAFMHYDFLYGTNRSERLQREFKKRWDEANYTNSETGSHIMIRLAEQRYNVDTPGAWSDGWVGTFMHAWQRDFIKELYPRQAERHVDRLMWKLGTDSSAAASGIPLEWETKMGLGFMATLASEVGDQATLNKIFDYVEDYWNPVWDDGRYYYPRNDDLTPDEKGGFRTVDTLAGNALLPFARLNRPDGIWKLYNEPWTEARLSEPYLTDVDELQVNVSQAIYDADREALIVTLKPVREGLRETSFAIANLNQNAAYTVIKDGGVIGRIPAHSADSKIDKRPLDRVGQWVSSAGRNKVQANWDTDGKLTIVTDLRRPYSFVIAMEQ